MDGVVVMAEFCWVVGDIMQRQKSAHPSMQRWQAATLSPIGAGSAVAAYSAITLGTYQGGSCLLPCIRLLAIITTSGVIHKQAPNQLLQQRTSPSTAPTRIAIMRFLNGLAFAGLAGLATAAASPPAQVYILSSTGPTPSPKREAQIPRQVARHIFLQRLSGQTRLGDDDLPASLGDDEALSYIAQYGKAPRPLFGDDAASSSPGTLEPSQLLVLIEDALDDIAAKKIPGFMAAQGFLPAFTIPDAPPAQANEHLVGTELAQFAGSCSLEAAANPYDDCWGGKMSLAVRYESTKVRHYAPVLPT